MLTKNINFKNFRFKKSKKKILFLLNNLLKEDNEILNSLKNTYLNSYSRKLIKRLKNFREVSLIGMGGSILGSKSIYNFLKNKIKKNFYFIDTFQFDESRSKKKKLNLIISKSGNTLETISNSNFMIKKKDRNIFITEAKDSYLMKFAKQLKSEIVHHNDFIGGRYSVLSEVGMLPAELMGLKVNKFRRFNLLVKNKKYINSLVQNVSNILYLIKNKKFNSVILNYDDDSSDLFFWYQQLVAESLGKKGKGVLPIISNMPKDNHSVMQLYLDGLKKNFYTLFFVEDSTSKRIDNNKLLKTHKYLRNKTLNKIKQSQFEATQKVFSNMNIPFRSFYIKKRNEETLGELFTFFILETILLGKALNINPYDQPAVELIKKETKKFLVTF